MKVYSLDELLKIVSHAAKSGQIIWVTGPSGHGKSFIGAEIDGTGAKCVHLDKYGKQENIGGRTRWAVSLPEDVAKTCNVFEGNADNPKVVAKLLYQRMTNGMAIVFAQASLRLFRSINAAKARDKKKSVDVPAAWITSWEKQSKISSGEFAKDWAKYRDMIIICVGAAVNEVEPLPSFEGCEPLTAMVPFWGWVEENKLEGKLMRIQKELEERKVVFRTVTNDADIKAEQIPGWHSNSAKEGSQSIKHEKGEEQKEVPNG